ncbi:dUTP pyrophosphatase [Paenibacillus turicensis]|uniref:dUTP diphosphatase n=1 Tax=Paenibacillus turicensis TaxID=160487 RepID=A0ABS4FZ30_9BACL|nr:deoxyuridine 5'-triphosphate nucleotidohydrolase [Paenibacillus turicensis]MBP1907794.1 dUTP pyrophosphatase [Paenibacillus turicensis]
MQVKVKKLNDNAVIPVYAKQGDSGFDLVSTKYMLIEPGETKIVPTGLSFEIPEGYEMQVRPRSGVTLRTKLRVQLGTIDSGYRGEIGIIIDNISTKIESCAAIDIKGQTVFERQKNGDPYELSQGTYMINAGDRIAQGVIVPVVKSEMVETDSLSDSERNTGGFGHTGV